MVKLLAITHDGPIRVTELGQHGSGLIWNAKPEDFQKVIDMVNAHGGPDFWRIEPVTL